MKEIRASVAIVDHVGIKAGMECYDVDLAKALNEAGFPAVVFSNFLPGSSSVKVIKAFRFRKAANIFSILEILRAYGRIASAIETSGIRHCIVHGFRFGFLEWMMIRKLAKTKTEISLIVHDPELLVAQRTSLRWRGKIFSLCRHLILHNDFSYRELSKTVSDSDKEKLVTIPHGNFVNAVQDAELLSIFEDLGIMRGKKHLLFFGQIKESKGLDLLIEALPQIDPSVNLIIAGRLRKHSFDIYKSLIEMNGLTHRVKLFLGYITPAMRNKLFHVADAVVLPYRKVYQSGVLIMAMSYGKAVIASDLPPNIEIVTNGKTGFLFRSGDKEALAGTINKVLSNDNLRQEAAKGGYQFAALQLSWKTIAEKWINLFKK